MSSDITWHAGELEPSQREAALGYRGKTLWLTGLSGSGKSTLATALEARLVRSGRPALVLDGDNLRHGLNAGLGFSAADREENVRRVAEVSRLVAEAGAISIVSLISPFRQGRAAARRIHQEAGVDFAEIWISTPIEVCRRRDPKGLYARAERGEIRGFTGLDSPYEAPLGAELELRTDLLSADEALTRLLVLVPERKQLP